MTRFIGRARELSELNQLLRKKSASLVVIRGRRRIGKSRLIYEFAQGNRPVFFTGLPPGTETTDQDQRDEFARQMAKGLAMPKVVSEDWSDLFWHLAQQVSSGRVVVVFDEISWMGSKDRNFLGKLKNAWDLYFSKNAELVLILCGSVSSWIEENILSSTGFVGRISLDMWLKELPLHDSRKFWGVTQASGQEILQMVSVTGGVPKYLEEVIPEQTTQTNIKRLCFSRGGLLYHEFDDIFSDLFSRRQETYRHIVEALAERHLTLDQLCTKLKVQKSGYTSKLLHHLILAGFVSENPSWTIRTGKTGRLKTFRVSDCYLRFYLKYIAPKKELIATGRGKPDLSLMRTVLGFQFETLILNYVEALFPLLDVRSEEVVQVGPYFQNATTRTKACQIDLLIQTKHRSLYVCELKSTNQVNGKVVDQMREKVACMAIPKGFSVRKVLIHTSEVSPSIDAANYFDYIIDAAQMLSVGD